MTRLFAAVVALAVAGCSFFSGEEAAAPPRATRIVSTTLAEGSILGPGAGFTVTVDGLGVVSARFGPREVSRFAAADALTVEFAAAEFPEGKSTLHLSVKHLSGSPTEVLEVRVDRSPPEIVRVEGTRLGAKGSLKVWVWDAGMLGSLSATFEGKSVERALPAEDATQALVVAEIAAEDLPEGRGALVLTLSDAAGNRAEQVLPEVLVDRVPPSARLLAPAEDSAIRGLMEIEVEAEDAIGPVSVEIRLAGSRLGEIAGPRGSLSIDAALFPEGPALLTATPHDDAGNWGAPASARVTVVR